MPTNEQRREAAKRKLERQLERRAQKARQRKQLTIAGSVVGVVVLVAGIALVYVLTKGSDDKAAAIPSIVSPATGCAYPPSQQPPAREVAPPSTDGEETTEVVTASIETAQGPIGLTLDNVKSPCTVNSFLSLASQGFFDNTTCHRLVDSPTAKLLQCGDPTGTGTGSPGYQFNDEYPVPKNEGEFAKGDLYKRGVVAMANSGAGTNTNGSQFFLVFGDSQFPPDYTIFGTIDEPGLATLDKIGAGGIVPGPGGAADGKPVLPADITSVTVDY